MAGEVGARSMCRTELNCSIEREHSQKPKKPKNQAICQKTNQNLDLPDKNRPQNRLKKHGEFILNTKQDDGGVHASSSCSGIMLPTRVSLSMRRPLILSGGAPGVVPNAHEVAKSSFVRESLPTR